jgi:hypothetical protein
MPDPEGTDSQTLPDGQPASQEAPAPTAPVDVEAIKQELRKEFEVKEQERVSGFQRLLNERDEEIARMRLEALPEGERERVEIEQTESYYSGIEQENWLYRKQSQSAEAQEAAQILYEFMNAPDRDAQFDILVQAVRNYRGAGQSALVEESATQTPPVDKNNPAPQVSGPVTLAPDGTPIDAGFAENFLRNLKEWPGS